MLSIDRIAERIAADEGLAVVPVVVIGAAEQDADLQVDVDEVGGDQLAVDDDARRDEHGAAPVGHVLVLVVADVGILERAPAAEQNAAPADLFVAGQRFVEEVEQVVVQRHAFLHEFDVAHQPGQVVGEQLHRRHRADAARIERRRMDVAPFHQAEHLARHSG